MEGRVNKLILEIGSDSKLPPLPYIVEQDKTETSEYKFSQRADKDKKSRTVVIQQCYNTVFLVLFQWKAEASKIILLSDSSLYPCHVKWTPVKVYVR